MFDFTEAYEYQFNDLAFGADEASSELDNGLSSDWRKPSDCALFAYHSEGSCEAVCAIPLLQVQYRSLKLYRYHNE